MLVVDVEDRVLPGSCVGQIGASVPGSVIVKEGGMTLCSGKKMTWVVSVGPINIDQNSISAVVIDVTEIMVVFV